MLFETCKLCEKFVATEETIKNSLTPVKFIYVIKSETTEERLWELLFLLTVNGNR